MEAQGDEIKTVAEQYVGINNKIGGIIKTLDDHTEMIGKMAIDISIIKEDISFIKQDLKRKVDRDEFAALERRVVLLEKRR
jgi:hypothetical protein